MTKKSNKLVRKTFTYDGKRYQVYGHTNKEIIEKESKKLQELQSGIEKLQNPTLNEYYKDFTDIRRNEIEESSIRSQSYQFKAVANEEITKGLKFGDMKIRDIRRKDIEKVRQKLLSEGKSTEHINMIFAHLNHVLHSAAIDETIDKNPCASLKALKRDRPKVKETIHRALSIEETQKFFDAARKRNSYYLNNFLVMIKTGMRVGEVNALRPMDIDDKNGFIHVGRTVTRDEIGGYIVSDSPKTECSIRDIPLTDELCEIFNNQWQYDIMLFGKDKCSKKDLLFRSVEGKILREYSVIREVERICKEANIPTFTSHAFRNTFATRFIEQRPQDYKILSEILGHKNVSITLNLYTHVMADNKKCAMKGIDIKTS